MVRCDRLKREIYALTIDAYRRVLERTKSGNLQSWSGSATTDRLRVPYSLGLLLARPFSLRLRHALYQATSPIGTSLQQVVLSLEFHFYSVPP